MDDPTFTEEINTITEPHCVCGHHIGSHNTGWAGSDCMWCDCRKPLTTTARPCDDEAEPPTSKDTDDSRNN